MKRGGARPGTAPPYIALVRRNAEGDGPRSRKSRRFIAIVT